MALEKKLLAMMEELKPLKAENATGKEELEQKTQVIKLMMQGNCSLINSCAIELLLINLFYN